MVYRGCFLVFLLGLLKLCKALPTKNNIPPEELNSLHDLYLSTNGSSWRYKSTFLFGNEWNFSVPDPNPCLGKWQGLECSSSCDLLTPAPCHITILNLPSYFLRGTLPDSLGQLKYLRNVILENNRISGSLPRALFNLTYLQEIDVSNNNLFGTIPREAFHASNLTSIIWNLNSFSGSIPSEIGLISELVFLDISNNQLTGTIPTTVSGMTSLIEFYASHNNLVGTIPAELFALPNISYINLMFNSLAGPLPPFSAGRRMRSLFLSGNDLTGPIPSDIASCVHLYALSLQGNAVTGTLPDMSNLTALVYIDLSNNLIHGHLPRYIDRFHSLGELSVYNNYFSSTLPDHLYHLTNLDTLLLQQNFFSGKPGPSFANGSTSKHFFVTTVDLSDNGFSGTIPVEIFLLPRIKSVSLVKNCFYGTLPEAMCNGSQVLEVMDLDGLTAGDRCKKSLFHSISNAYSSYFIQGGLLPCLFQMPRLRILHLSGNGILGTIPSVDISPTLRNLSLAYNRLSGTIPLPVQRFPFKELDLSFNKLTGTCLDMEALPLSAKLHINTTQLSLEVNRLSGPMPSNFYEATDINVVTGNIFDCANKDELPIHDPGTPNSFCGSYVTNMSFAALGIFLGLGSLFLIAYCVAVYYFQPSHKSSSSLATPQQQQQQQQQQQEEQLPTPAQVSETAPEDTDPAPFWHYVWRQAAPAFRNNKLVEWYSMSWNIQHNPPADLSETRIFLLLLAEFRYMFVVLGVFILAFNLPIFLFIQYVNADEYSTHKYQYAWTPSLLFTQGSAPTLVMFLLTAITSSLTLYFILRIDSKEIGGGAMNLEPKKRSSALKVSRTSKIMKTIRKSIFPVSRSTDPVEFSESGDSSGMADENSDGSSSSPSFRRSSGKDTLSPNSRFSGSSRNAAVNAGVSTLDQTWTECFLSIFNKKRRVKFVLYFLFPLVNIILMLIANAVYLYIILTRSSVYQFAAQFFILSFKLSWNVFVIPTALNLIRTSKPMFVRKLSIQMLLLLFNIIVAPFLASMVASSNCFLDAFGTTDSVVVRFSYDVCYIYLASGVCVLYVKLPLSTSFYPPFLYSYQCSSSVLQDYVPIYIEMYSLLAVGYPFFVTILCALLSFPQAQEQQKLSFRFPFINGLSRLANRLILKGVVPAVLGLPSVALNEYTGDSPSELSTGTEMSGNPLIRSTESSRSIVTSQDGRSRNMSSTSQSDEVPYNIVFARKSIVPFSSRDVLSPTVSFKLESEDSVDGYSSQTLPPMPNPNPPHRMGESMIGLRSSNLVGFDSRPTSVDTVENIKHQTSSSSIGSAIDVQSPFAKRILNPGIIFSHLICHLAVLLTFGFAYPPLGGVILISVLVLTTLWQILVGRYVQHISSAKFSPATQLMLKKQLEWSCKGVRYRLFHRIKWVIIGLKSAFFILFAFDMTAFRGGDVMSWVWAPVSIAIFPLVVWLGQECYFNREEIRSVSRAVLRGLSQSCSNLYYYFVFCFTFILGRLIPTAHEPGPRAGEGIHRDQGTNKKRKMASHSNVELSMQKAVDGEIRI